MLYMNKEEQDYFDILYDIITNGIVEENDRTGVGTKFLVGKHLKFNLSGNRVPMLQTREIYWKNVFNEIIWIIRGASNTKFLKDRNVNIWNSWADENGNLGPVYGVQLRKWNNKVDQLQNLIDGIKNNPGSRRHIFTLWNPEDVNKVILPPCHAIVSQFSVDSNKKELYMAVTCRSTDWILGCPVNIAEWSLFAHFVANLTGLTAREISFSFNNAHVYLNHLENAQEWLKRGPMKSFPTINIKKELKTIADLEAFSMSDVELIDYCPEKPNIKFPVAV